MITFGAPEPGAVYTERLGAYGFLFNESERLAVVRIPGGLFLPGGGVEAGEDLEQALEREFTEEIGFAVTRARLLGQSAQYHRSVFYNAYFRKVGTFFAVDATPLPGAVCAKDHALEWMSVEQAKLNLSQEFQRWAVAEWASIRLSRQGRSPDR